MIAVDEDALICDLAETYHVYGLESLPVELIATLAAGLRSDSRVKLKAAGLKADQKTILLAMAVDRLSFLAWAKTKDAEKNINRPASIASRFFEQPEEEKKLMGFDSPEDFMKARAEIMRTEEESHGL